MPRKPTDPISEADAVTRSSFYKGEHDDEGRLVRFTKFLNGHIAWSDEYAYWDDGNLRRRTMTKEDGSETVEEYNHRGKLAK